MAQNLLLPEPYHQLVAELDQKDVMVMENVSAHPALNDMFVNDFLLIVLVHHGEVLNNDETAVILQSHDVSLLMPGQMILPVKVTDDWCHSCLAVSRAFYKKLVLQYPYMRYDDLFHRRPLCRLSEEQFGNVLDAVNLLRTIARGNSPFR